MLESYLLREKSNSSHTKRRMGPRTVAYRKCRGRWLPKLALPDDFHLTVVTCPKKVSTSLPTRPKKPGWTAGMVRKWLPSCLSALSCACLSCQLCHSGAAFPAPALNISSLTWHISECTASFLPLCVYNVGLYLWYEDQ